MLTYRPIIYGTDPKRMRAAQRSLIDSRNSDDVLFIARQMKEAQQRKRQQSPEAGAVRVADLLARLDRIEH